MEKRMTCECGLVVTGVSDADFVAKARSHFEEVHADVSGEIDDAELLAQAEED